MPPTAEQGEPVGAAPVDEKLAESLEEIGTVDTFDVGQIHVSVGYGGEWYGWYACNRFWEGGDALNLPSHTFLLCIFCLVVQSVEVCEASARCPEFHLPLFPKWLLPQDSFSFWSLFSFNQAMLADFMLHLIYITCIG